MVTTSRKEVLQKEIVQNDSSAASNKRKTRGTKKVIDIEEANRNVEKEANMPRESGRHKKTVPKDTDQLISTKGKRKEKTMSPAIVNVVFGKMQGSVADVDELRQKREEDTFKCGRVVKSVGKLVNTTSVPSNSITDSEDNAPQKHQEEESNHKTPNHSPNFSAHATSTGEFLWSLRLK